MKKENCLVMTCLVWVLVAAVFLQTAQATGAGKGTLKVVVDGCPSDKGVVRIALADSREGYKDSSKALMTKKVQISKGRAVFEFQDVPFGEYAITAYHDENGNDKLDRSGFGKPIEAYGFSNNARGLISRPDYKEAAFVLDKTETAMKIKVE